MVPIPLVAVAGGLTYIGLRARQSAKRPLYLAITDAPNQQPSAPVKKPSALVKLKNRALQSAAGIVDRLAGSERQAQMQTLSSTAEERTLSPEEQQANTYMAVAFGCLGVTTVGRLVYPPLALLSVPGLLYTAYPFMKAGIDDLRTKRKITATTLDLLSIPGATVLGNFFAASLAVSLLSLSAAVLKRTEDRSLQSIANVFGQHPTTVWALVDGVEVEVPFANIRAGDLLVVTAGQMIAADGVVIEGAATVDQRMLTGESQPSEKTVGDEVFAASLLLAGRLLIQVKRAGETTIAAKIGEILLQTADFKQTFESRSQVVADRWTLPTLAAAIAALPLRGASGGIAILLSSLGYNLRIVGPLSMLNFLRLAAQQGILVKDARSLELLQSIDTVVFDKTGTLTLEQPQVQQLYTYNDWAESTVLAYAAAAESRQSHPIARAIVEAAQARDLAIPAIDDARYEVGYGLKVTLGDIAVSVGSERFMRMEGIALPATVTELHAAVHHQGHSLVFVSINGDLAGALQLAPTIRPEAHHLIAELHARGTTLYIISGDQEEPTRHLATTLGIDHYFANTLPEHKATLIQQLQNNGKRVCFVGDGINDAIALKQADVSVSLRGASTIATDTAQIVLMDASLDQLRHLFDLTKAYDANMRANHVASMAPGMIVIGGVFLLHFGIIASIMLYNIGLVAGVANSMAPLLRNAQPTPPPPQLTANEQK